jgi:hypothetical protein
LSTNNSLLTHNSPLSPPPSATPPTPTAVKSDLTKAASQLDAERALSQELRQQLEAIKSEYITAGMSPCHSTARRLPPPRSTAQCATAQRGQAPDLTSAPMTSQHRRPWKDVFWGLGTRLLNRCGLFIILPLASHVLCSPRPTPTPNPPPPPSPGDLLESEQNSSVALRKELQDLEKKVETLQGNNSTLGKEVRPHTHRQGPAPSTSAAPAPAGPNRSQALHVLLL